MSDLNDHTVNKLSIAIGELTDELKAAREIACAGLVSRTDLAETEARITAAIGAAWSIEDQQTLDGRLAFARRKTLRLEALDASLPTVKKTP